MLSRILYEDNDIIVAHKPAGIAVQTARIGQADMVSELKNHLRRIGCDGPAASRGGEPYLGIVHRLDQPVEGILVFAKTKAAAAALTGQLRAQDDEGGFGKRYYAVLCGMPTDRQGWLTDHLYKQAVKNGTHIDYIAVVKSADSGRLDQAGCQSCPEGQECPESRKAERTDEEAVAQAPDSQRKGRLKDRQKSPAGEGKARRAVLEYRILQTREEQGLALADIRIQTGRFHQIRAQMAHAGMPLLGDSKYGNQRTLALARSLGIRNVALCAYHLSFLHPASKREMDFSIRPENLAFSSFSP